ncbi:hypothetical protein LTR84_005693 [Exophiala bonariae]|uniref:SnoaL-like domain-containing protein n=1 Tax=Exophiala bonariae TaxID=1690606 RepID=A0AAV9N351_9EURO|nr:hypothetical protein LTR84_005693 [Exophiala bonariae]
MAAQISVQDKTRDDYLHLDLAPSYGTLNSEAMKKMDDELKIMIAGTMKDLGRVPPNQRSWDKVISIFMQNPLLEPHSDPELVRADKFIKNSSGDFKFDGSPNAAIVQEVKTWFTKLIADDDVIKSTKIDVEVLAKIVAQTGATVDSFETFFAKHEYHEKTLVDIGVLRFPDAFNPYFKVYRIQLVAWSDSSRILFHQEDKNGITGEYHCRKFKPRDAVISELKEQTKKLAIKQAEDLFA